MTQAIELTNGGIENQTSRQLKLRFDHGLGDCIHFAAVMQMYLRRGWKVNVHFEGNKAALWQAANIPYCSIEGTIYHDWHYPEGFNRPLPEIDFSGSKAFGNLHRNPFPPLGSLEDTWKELCESVNLDGCISSVVRDDQRQQADTFLQHLPEPIILLHTHGTNFQEAKNLPNRTVSELYGRLLEGSNGSIVLLDWDHRVPPIAHGRVRHVKDDWGHIDLYQLGALFERASLLIGVDSGPYHFAAFTNTPALGIFHQHYPSCITLPRRRNLNMTREGYRKINISRRQRWNIVEYAGNLPSAMEISRHALRMLEAPRYLSKPEQIAEDVQLQQWTRDWCKGSTSLSPLADRNNTFDILFRELTRSTASPVIVETGCIRSQEDWKGTGYSTYLFAALLSRLGQGCLISIDNNEERSNFARKSIAGWNVKAEFVVDDSVHALRSLTQSIDLLYLDSVDVGEPEFQRHALREILAAEGKIRLGGFVVIDDTVWIRGWQGKGALAIPYLLKKGWKVLGLGYQVVLTKNIG